MRQLSLDPRLVAITAVMTAMVFVLTSAVKVPTPAVGYVHLGDTAVFFAALAFGPWVGGIAGGLGTALADLSGGYAQWAPISFLVHGLQGWLAGIILHRESPWKRLLASRSAEGGTAAVGYLLAGAIVAVLAGGVVVVAGYYLGGSIIVGSGQAALEIPFNTVQAAIGGVLGILLYLAARLAYPPLARH